MYRQHTIGVVVPAYNEEGFVGEVLRTVPEYVDRIYAVDDASTDGTWDEIREAAAELNDGGDDRIAAVGAEGESTVRGEGDESPAAATDGGPVFDRRVVPIRHEENRGVGGAIKTGYLEALEDKIEITAVMGGDGQMDPDILPRFLDPIVEGEADYTKGNRLADPEYREGMSRWRFFGNSALTFLTKISSGYWKMMDPQNGYTAVSRRALETVNVEEMYEYYGYCNDLLVKLNAHGLRVADVRMPAVYGDEESSIDYPSYIWNVSGMLLRNFCWRLKARYLVLDFHPLALFYLFGAAISGVGVAGIAWSLYAWLALAYPLFVRGSLSILLFITGSLFLLFAMLFDMQANESMEV